MTHSISEDIRFLTSTIDNAASKPHLGSTLTLQLVKLGYELGEAEAATKEFFGKTVH